jgi:alanine or glycine:cation symporter, AGCS family
MEVFERIVNTFASYLWDRGIPFDGQEIPWVVIALLGTGLFLTVRLGFIQLRKLGHGFAVTSGMYDDPDEPGDVSHFQALTTRCRRRSASATSPASRSPSTGAAPGRCSGCG